MVTTTQAASVLSFESKYQHNEDMQFGSTLAHLFFPRTSNNHRARVLHPEVLIVLAVLMLAAVTSLHSVPFLPGRLGSVLGFASAITADQVIEQTNQQRSEEGLDPLITSQELSAAALAKGQDMFEHQYWAHTSPQGTTPWSFIKGTGYTYQVAGENLARDFIETDEMVEAWMASPTHKANIINPRYQEIGIAVINGRLDGVETTLVVQMFGRPSDGAVGNVLASSSEPPGLVGVAEAQESLSMEMTDMPVVTHSSMIDQLPPLFAPLQLLKAVFLALLLLLVMTLMYDSVVIGNYAARRLVGHNLSHILVLLAVAYLIISFKGGVLG